MHLHDARNLAWELMRHHGLSDAGWRFEFDHARRRFGRCDYTNKRITLSRPLTLLNGPDEVRDTVLHEIAHALTPGDGHGRRWRAACRRVGARPQRCYDDAAVVSPPRRPAPYLFGCPSCDWWADRRRMTSASRRYVCARCRGVLIYRHKADGSAFRLNRRGQREAAAPPGAGAAPSGPASADFPR